MKIGFFEIEPWEKKLLKKAFPKDTLLFTDQKITSANSKKFKDLDVISTFIQSKLDPEALKHLPNLKFIATRSTGFDHLDLEHSTQKGIKISNVPTYGENTVAELAFALILGLSRKLITSVEKTRKKKFDNEGLRGVDLCRKTLGVVGTGNIGKYAVRMGKGFSMNVVAFDVVKDKKFAKKIGFTYVNLKKLFQVSDVITLHVPYNKHTHHLVNRKMFSLMKKGSYLVNTSRGGVIDTLAMVQALKSGKLAGVGLDVLEEERALIEQATTKGEHWKKANKKILKANQELLKMNNVFITPHNGFNTTEAIMRILNTTIDNINGFKKKKLVNVVKV